MPTKNPRVAVTLKPSTSAALKRMSDLSGNSQSAIIGELLEAAEPVFERMCKVIEAAKFAQSSVKERIVQNLQDAEAVLNGQLGLMLGDLETRSRDMIDGLEEVQRRQSPGTEKLRRHPPGAVGGVVPLAAHRRREGPPLLTGGSGTPTRTRDKRATITRNPSGKNRLAKRGRK